MAFKGIPYFWGAIATTKCIRAIAFALDAQLTKGNVEVLLLDKKKHTLLKLNRQFPSQTIDLDGENNRYYLRWEFKSASGKCELRW